MKEIIKSSGKNSRRILGIGYAALLLGMLLLVVLTPYGTNAQTTYDYPMWQILLCGCAIFLLLFLLFSKYKGWSCNRPSPVVGICSVLFFFLLVFLSHNYYFKTGWDPREVISAAGLMADGKTQEINPLYFSMFPNNRLLVILYSYVIRGFRLLGLNNDYYGCIIFQCFIFSVSGYLTYRVAGMLTDLRCAAVAYVSYLLFVGLSPWVTVPYSDGTGLVLPLLLMYLYLLGKRSVKRWVELLGIFLVYFVGYFSYKIKPQIFIMIIALTLLGLVDFFGTKQKGEYVGRGVAAVCGFACGIFLVTGFIGRAELPVNEEMAFDPWYYLCTGAYSESNGVCNVEDQTYALSFDTKQARSEALKKRFFERLKENGVAGTLDLWRRKSLMNYSDGTFGWWIEGGFYGEEIYPDKMPLREKLAAVYYDTNYGGTYFTKYEAFMQALWLAVLALNVLLPATGGRNRGFAILMLSIIGLTIFELLFECRARYLFTYAPVYLIGAVGGLYGLSLKLKRKKA